MRAALKVTAALGLAVCAAEAPGQVAKLSDAERAEICRDADARYRGTMGTTAPDPSVTVILMFKDTFCPQNLTVKQGDRLRWINVDKRTSHSIWFKDAGREESDRKFPEEFVEMTVDLPPGEHTYLCGPHWEKEGMIGRLTVRGR